MKRFLFVALFCVILSLAGWLVFSFPYQRHYAERTFEAYTQLQGVDSELHFTVALPKGEPENPLSREETRNKFLGLSSPVLGKSKAEKLLQVIELRNS